MAFSNTLLIFLAVIMLLIVIIYYNSTAGFVGRRNYNYYSYPMFNLGTREWFPTHLQSYDVRGDIPIGYYPIGAFNQPERPARGFYPVIEPNFYTYEYVNPVQGFYPPAWNSNYSVPFKVDNKNSISSGGSVKPILDNP
jgi:hypothetical protein